MTTTASHYAEKVRNLVARLDEHHRNAVAMLCQPEVSIETCRAIQDTRMTLEAELKHAASQLSSVVLAETVLDTTERCPDCGHAPHWGGPDATPHSYCSERASWGSPCCGCGFRPTA